MLTSGRYALQSRASCDTLGFSPPIRGDSKSGIVRFLCVVAIRLKLLRKYEVNSDAPERKIQLQISILGTNTSSESALGESMLYHVHPYSLEHGRTDPAD